MNRLRYIRNAAILAAAVTLGTSGCFRGAGALLFAGAAAAVVTAAIISSRPPPPPRVVFIPPPREGFVWQPGYWTLQEGQWIWIDGRWQPVRYGYSYVPPHWEQTPDGNYRLVPEQWVPSGPQPGYGPPQGYAPPPPPPQE